MRTPVLEKKVAPKGMYHVEGFSCWYIVKAPNKRIARKDATNELGRGRVKGIRVPTLQEYEYYVSTMGEPREVFWE